MKKHNIAQISFLIACGSALQLAESFIPFPVPIPGLKIGLSNISTVLGLVLFGAGAGFEVAVFRPIITSLTNGTFLSPGLVLSFCGSVVSFAAMALCYYLTRYNRLYSLIAISIVGAVVHNLAEVVLAYYWLFPHAAILALAPVLAVAAVIGGYLVGWSSRYVLEKIEKAKPDTFSPFTGGGDADGPLKELTVKDKAKILIAFILVLSTVFLRSILTYSGLILVVILLIILYGETVYLISSRIFRLWSVILFSFILPVIFSPEGRVIWQEGILKITDTGIHQGTLFALRLLFLIFISIWIGVTEPSKLSQELAWILSPLRFFKFSVDRIPRLTSLSLSFIPVIWEKMTHVKPKTLRTVLDALAVFFVGLESESPVNQGIPQKAEDNPATGGS